MNELPWVDDVMVQFSELSDQVGDIAPILNAINEEVV